MWRQVVSLALLAILCTTYIQGYYFDYYVYAQQWPTPFCESSRYPLNTWNGNCAFAKNISAWTIHGLWPSVNETYPNNCQDWPLKESDIYGLEDEMRAQWPSFSGGESFDFWQHEWEKHGTCATIVPFLYGPFKYFDFALRLNIRYSMLQALANSSSKILPVSGDCYDYSDFESATQEAFGESVILGCVWDEEAKQQHIAQIEICFDKSFQFTCNPELIRRRGVTNYNSKLSQIPYISPCRASEKICYMPIPH